MPPKSLKSSKSTPSIKTQKSESKTKTKEKSKTKGEKEVKNKSNDELVVVEVKEGSKGESKGETKEETKVEEKTKKTVVLGPPSEADVLTYGKALLQSISEGDLKSLKRFLGGKGSYLHATVFGYKNNAGNTALILACQRPKEPGAEEIVTELLAGKN
jgi:hypothetical protein